MEYRERGTEFGCWGGDWRVYPFDDFLCLMLYAVDLRVAIPALSIIRYAFA